MTSASPMPAHAGPDAAVVAGTLRDTQMSGAAPARFHTRPPNVWLKTDSDFNTAPKLIHEQRRWKPCGIDRFKTFRLRVPVAPSLPLRSTLSKAEGACVHHVVDGPLGQGHRSTCEQRATEARRNARPASAVHDDCATRLGPQLVSRGLLSCSAAGA